jgi:hypothetical protein
MVSVMSRKRGHTMTPRARAAIEAMRTLAPNASIMEGGKLCEGFEPWFLAGLIEAAISVETDADKRKAFEGMLAWAERRWPELKPSAEIIPFPRHACCAR